METELHVAAKANDAARVTALLASGAKIDARDKDQRTPLLVATHANAIDAARVLIEAGADVNAKDNIRDTPFLYAGAEGRLEILRMILPAGSQSQGHQPLWRQRPDPRRPPRPSRNRARIAEDEDRHRPRQPPRLDGAARNHHPLGRRPRRIRTSCAADRCGRRREPRRWRRRLAAHPCQAAWLYGDGDHAGTGRSALRQLRHQVAAQAAGVRISRPTRTATRHSSH